MRGEYKEKPIVVDIFKLQGEKMIFLTQNNQSPMVQFD